MRLWIISIKLYFPLLPRCAHLLQLLNLVVLPLRSELVLCVPQVHSVFLERVLLPWGHVVIDVVNLFLNILFGLDDIFVSICDSEILDVLVALQCNALYFLPAQLIDICFPLHDFLDLCVQGLNRLQCMIVKMVKSVGCSLN